MIPIVAEKRTVGKRVEEHGGVRIVKSVVTKELTTNESTVHESASVDRIAVNRPLAVGEALPLARRGGDTMISTKLSSPRSGSV